MPQPTRFVASLCILLVSFFAASMRAEESSAPLPGVESLKPINQLPDPFLMNDGSRVKTKDDWARRRAELRDMILGYEYGHVPTETPEVKATETALNGRQPANVKQYNLTIGGKVSVPLVLTLPEGKGPFRLCRKPTSTPLSRTNLKTYYC